MQNVYQPYHFFSNWLSTGSAALMYRAWLEELLGLHVRGETMWFAPVISGKWEGFQLSYRHGDVSRLVAAILGFDRPHDNQRGYLQFIKCSTHQALHLPRNGCTVVAFLRRLPAQLEMVHDDPLGDSIPDHASLRLHSTPFSAGEMGNICGLSRVSVSHVFTALERDRVIDRDGRLVVVRNRLPPARRQLATVLHRDRHIGRATQSFLRHCAAE